METAAAVTRSDLAPLLTELVKLQDVVALDKRHCYRIGKATVPGVTTIIKTLDAPALDAWKVRVQVEGTARAAYLNTPDDQEPEDSYIGRLVAIAKEEFEHERLANEAADVGKQVHALIEHTVKEQLGQETTAPEATDEALFVFAGWREWAESARLEPLVAEARLHHPGLNYCGTADLVCLVNGEPTILDWKPQARLYDERRLQLAAYRMALVAAGWPPLQGAIVCLPRDGGEISMVPACAPGPELDATFSAFVSLLNVYRWQREVAKAARQAARDEAA